MKNHWGFGRLDDFQEPLPLYDKFIPWLIGCPLESKPQSDREARGGLGMEKHYLESRHYFVTNVYGFDGQAWDVIFFSLSRKMTSCTSLNFHKLPRYLDVKKWVLLFIWMFPKIRGKPPKWMVYNGKPY